MGADQEAEAGVRHPVSAGGAGCCGTGRIDEVYDEDGTSGCAWASTAWSGVLRISPLTAKGLGVLMHYWYCPLVQSVCCANALPSQILLSHEDIHRVCVTHSSQVSHRHRAGSQIQGPSSQPTATCCTSPSSEQAYMMHVGGGRLEVTSKERSTCRVLEAGAGLAPTARQQSTV